MPRRLVSMIPSLIKALRRLRDNLDYLYFLRVPIGVWAFVGLLGWLAETKLARPLLKNLFEVSGREAFWTGFFAANACFAALASAIAIATGAPARFRNGRAGPAIGYGLRGFLSILPMLALMRHLQTSAIAFALVSSILANALLVLLAGGLAAGFRIPYPRRFRGYAELPEGGSRLLLRREHVFCLAVAMVYFVVFLGVAAYRQRELFARGPAPSPGDGPPTLAFLFAAAAFLCLLLSGLTFFLDRYRIPLSAIAIALLLITLWRGNGEHVFRVFARQGDRPTARAVLSPPGRAILVAASGGGIQASAWTARVLTGLAANPGFAASVRAISAVSGGSLGALCFARTFPSAAENALPWTPEEAFRASMLPSLDSIAYGLVRYDLPRIFFLEPGAEYDRGWTLETTLARRSGLDGARLSGWAARAGKDLPAMIFNATAMEAGSPLVFATTRMPAASGIIDFAETEDLDIATAVRLSATFPFVSPAARPEGSAISHHVGDGGYYDNSGLESLIAWFEDGADPAAKGLRVLLIQISAFPPGDPAALRSQSWLYDIWSPLDALMGVRTAGQSIHERNDLNRMVAAKRIEPVQFQYAPKDRSCAAPSLSWNMDAHEQACIDSAWKEQGEAIAKVKAFLKGAR